jgi:hypothetical protein
MTLRSVSAYYRIELGGKPILFVGDLGRLSSEFPFTLCLPSIGSSQASFIGHQIENSQLQQPMRAQTHAWNDVLLSSVDDQTRNV